MHDGILVLVIGDMPKFYIGVTCPYISALPCPDANVDGVAFVVDTHSDGGYKSSATYAYCQLRIVGCQKPKLFFFLLA